MTAPLKIRQNYKKQLRTQDVRSGRNNIGVDSIEKDENET